MNFSPTLKTNAKANARQRRYAARHPEKQLERHQAWRDAKREKYRAWGRANYLKNRKRILAGQKRRREKKLGLAR